MGWGDQRKNFVKNFNDEAKKVEDKIKEVIADPRLIEDGLRKLVGHIEEGAEKLVGYIEDGDLLSSFCGSSQEQACVGDCFAANEL